MKWLLAGLGLGMGIAVAAGAAQADEGGLNSSLPAGERGAGSAAGAEGSFYVPGMPVPKPADPQAAGDAKTEKGPSGGKISKITVVDRSGSASTERPPAPEIYHGIIPGSRNSHARTDRDRAKAERKPPKQNSVYWLGFNPATADKGSVVFVQTLLPGAIYDVSVTDTGLELTIQNARVKRSNDLRVLDTHFWPGLVSSVQAQRRGSDVVVVVTLEAPAGYEVRQESDFIFIQFKDPDATPPGTL